MNELTDRQKFILTLVVHEYIKSAGPVGSQHLVERYRLDMSSATVRNELGMLTEMGYLRQPHTSAGRVPTEEGYRYFVGRLLQETELPDTTRRTITHQFYQMRNDVDQWMRLSASVLAHQSRSASLVTAPHPETSHFKHVELISTRGRQVLMVLVMVGGEIHQRLFSLNDHYTQEMLSTVANKLTHLFESKDAETIRSMRGMLQDLELEAIEWILTEMDQANIQVAGEVFMDGLSNVLAEPEFIGSETAHRALRVLEERSRLQDLLSRTVATSISGGVQVLIGGEGTWEELSQFSIVLARYGTPGLITGTLGVVGPMRMPYGRAISTIRFLSGLLSELVSDTLVD
jgi:heat-inducible transcriptional repressor